MTSRVLVGKVSISSINQIGESIRYDSKSQGYGLARSSSAFDLYIHSDNEHPLPDFRLLPSIAVSFESEGRLLALDSETGKCCAVSALDQPVPPNAIFQCVKRKFDTLSASISSQFGGSERWLRHCNSRLRV